MPSIQNSSIAKKFWSTRQCPILALKTSSRHVSGAIPFDESSNHSLLFNTIYMWLSPKISVFHFLPRSSIFQRMVLADLGRKLTTALRSLGNSPVINEEVLERKSIFSSFFWNIMIFCRKNIKLSQRGMPCANGGRCEHQAGETIERWCKRFETCN